MTNEALPIQASSLPRDGIGETVDDYMLSPLFAGLPAPFLLLKPDDPRFTIVGVNDAYLNATLTTRDSIIGRPLFEVFPDNPEDETATGVGNLHASLRRALASKMPDKMARQKYDIIKPDGSFDVRWWDPTNSPILNEDGDVEILVHHVTDATLKVRAEAAMSERQAWLAGQREAFQCALNGAELATSLRALVDTTVEQMGGKIRCAFYVANGEGTELYHLVGMPESYKQCIDGFKIGPESLACGLAVHTGRPVITPDVATEPLWKDWVWVAEQFNYRGCWSFPIETSTGKVVGTLAMYHEQPRNVVARDYELAAAMAQAAAIIITQSQEKEERARVEMMLAESEKLLQTALARQKTLTAEMDHRVKNVFMIVESIIRLSRRTATGGDDFADYLSGRLHALAAAHALVRREFSPSNTPPKVTALNELIEAVLLPYKPARQTERSPFVVSGPRVICVERAVTGLALVFHELTTNAAKHGALSEERGEILIDWKVEKEMLTVKWREKTARTEPPAISNGGYGKSLLESVVSYQFGGRIEQRWIDRGLQVELALPLPAVTA